MPIDDTKWNLPARQGDVAVIAINTRVALIHIANALEEIAAGKPPSAENISRIKSASDFIDENFVRLAGWTNE